MGREFLHEISRELSESAKVDLITAHLLLQPCYECSKSVEYLSPNNEASCFGCQLSPKQRWKNLALLLPSATEISRSHNVQFYSTDEVFLDTFTRFIGTALKSGDAVIVVVTQSHRNSLSQQLQAHGLDVVAAAEQGRYIPLDVADTLATFMVDDFPDQGRFMEAARALILAAANTAGAERPRVAACVDCAPLLWKEGKIRAAIRLEQLWDQVAKTYGVDILCGYPGSILRGEQRGATFRSICADHSAVYCR